MISDIFSQFIVPIATGIVATVLFTIGFYRGLRPRIAISDYISLGENGRMYVKIANKCRLASLYNIRVYAFLTRCQQVESGKDQMVIPLENGFDNMKLNFLNANRKRFKYTSHATIEIVIPNEEAVRLLVNGKCELMIQVTAVHGWSNVSGTKNNEYKLPHALKNYPFKEGNDVNIDNELLERNLKILVRDKSQLIPLKRLGTTQEE